MHFTRPGHPSQLQRKMVSSALPLLYHHIWRTHYTVKARSWDNDLSDNNVYNCSSLPPEFKQLAALSSAQEIPGNHDITSSWENLLLVSYLSLQPHGIYLQSVSWLGQPKWMAHQGHLGSGIEPPHNRLSQHTPSFDPVHPGSKNLIIYPDPMSSRRTLAFLCLEVEYDRSQLYTSPLPSSFFLILVQKGTLNRKESAEEKAGTSDTRPKHNKILFICQFYTTHTIVMMKEKLGVPTQRSSIWEIKHQPHR